MKTELKFYSLLCISALLSGSAVADDSAGTAILNRTLDSAMSETIYVHAHNKKNGEWQDLGHILSVSFDNIFMDTDTYDKFYLSAYKGTQDSDIYPVISCLSSNANCSNGARNVVYSAKIHWSSVRLKVFLERED
ncbi:hypothetical protein D5R81_15845 [Parashewanella spongiae]|uniref:Uncharacterized protein n=1 Tax=Parashewanella spongiae TaxID=342950 RepID=A0A3A6TF62_9GAMM|nr:hypothetical protein [Parashewanella spongiae]MCL1079102.1 hypothetical protein [Parashewanella spongiae]RJY07413.1 hypothetical protein D5R81_15845 [Parashewanella spongiae]